MHFDTVAALESYLVSGLQSKPTEIGYFVETLSENTGPGKLIDPINGDPAMQPWSSVLGSLINARLFTQGAEFGKAWYDCLSYLQWAVGKRYHKGTPTHNTAYCYYQAGNHNAAFWFQNLAFIEDIISGNGQGFPESPATKNLRLLYGFGKKELSSAAAQIWSNKAHPLSCYPEFSMVSLLLNGTLTPPIVQQATDLPINQSFLKKLIEQLPVGDNPDKKESLEFLASYLASTLPNATIRKNVKAFETGATFEHELDLIVTQRGSSPTYLLEALGRHFLVECKNWKTPVGAKELNHFVAKMRFHRCRFGVILSRSGMSEGDYGKDGLKYARVTQLRWYHHDDCIVTVLNNDHLEQLTTGSKSFGDLLLQGYESVRFSDSTF